MSGYEYDVFVSYSRSGNVCGWVQNHLCEVLRSCLIDELGGGAKVFLDVEMRPGDVWPIQLEQSLSRSKVMVAVWSPPYFESSWCMAEAQTMLERERCCELAGSADPRGLIFPLVFADGRNFPDWASERQSVDFKRWSYPYPHFRESRDYLGFHQAVRALAEQIAERLETVPAWRPDWPVMRDPKPYAAPRAALPEL